MIEFWSWICGGFLENFEDMGGYFLLYAPLLLLHYASGLNIGGGPDPSGISFAVTAAIGEYYREHPPPRNLDIDDLMSRIEALFSGSNSGREMCPKIGDIDGIGYDVRSVMDKVDGLISQDSRGTRDLKIQFRVDKDVILDKIESTWSAYSALIYANVSSLSTREVGFIGDHHGKMASLIQNCSMAVFNQTNLLLSELMDLELVVESLDLKLVSMLTTLAGDVARNLRMDLDKFESIVTGTREGMDRLPSNLISQMKHVILDGFREQLRNDVQELSHDVVRNISLSLDRGLFTHGDREMLQSAFKERFNNEDRTVLENVQAMVEDLDRTQTRFLEEVKDSRDDLSDRFEENFDQIRVDTKKKCLSFSECSLACRLIRRGLAKDDLKQLMDDLLTDPSHAPGVGRLIGCRFADEHVYGGATVCAFVIGILIFCVGLQCFVLCSQSKRLAVLSDKQAVRILMLERQQLLREELRALALQPSGGRPVSAGEVSGAGKLLVSGVKIPKEAFVSSDKKILPDKKSSMKKTDVSHEESVSK